MFENTKIQKYIATTRNHTSLAGQCSTKPNVTLNRPLCPEKGQKFSPAVTKVTFELLLINIGDLHFPLAAVLRCKLGPEHEPTHKQNGLLTFFQIGQSCKRYKIICALLVSVASDDDKYLRE